VTPPPTGPALPAARPGRGGRDLRRVLDDLLAMVHLRGGLVVAPDGLVIAARLPEALPVEPLSALAAALGRELELHVQRAHRSPFVMAHFSAADGTVFVGGTPVGFIVLLGDGDPGTHDEVRQALRAAVETVRRAWAA
jgi:predicted regulator of Ras-like GTPase activity (Roadblock/LC7/MglB family)